MSTPVKMIITGSRGVVGSALVKWMRTHHPEVDVISLLPFPFSLTAVHGALAGGNVRYFVNCAGEARDTDSLVRPYEFYDTNAFGVLKQLEIIRQHSPATRYLNFGTVYEATHLTPYASSKRLSRDIIKTYRDNFGLYALQATLGLTEGFARPDSFLSKKITKGVARIAAAMKAGQPFEPLELRDIDEEYTFTWAEDVADGVWRMLNQEFPTRSNVNGTMIMNRVDGPLDVRWPREYTLSNNDSHSVREFAKLAFQEAGIEGYWLDGDPEVFVRTIQYPNALVGGGCLVRTSTTVEENAHYPSESPVWDDDYYTAQTDLGWIPRHSFEDIVRTMTRHELEKAGL